MREVHIQAKLVNSLALRLTNDAVVILIEYKVLRNDLLVTPNRQVI
jgi:flagellar biosynthesis regulator FlbT